MEIRRAGGESTQDRALHLSDVGPSAGDERAAGIGGGLHFKSRVVGEGEHGKIANVQRTGEVAGSDVYWQWKRVIAGVGSRVASAAGAGNGGDSEDVVQSGNPGDVDRCRIEQGLAPGDAGAAQALNASKTAALLRPAGEQIEDSGIEGSFRFVVSERIVDSDVEGLGGDCLRTASGAVRVQVPGEVIVTLGGGESHFKVHDLLHLGVGRDRTLGMSGGGVD